MIMDMEEQEGDLITTQHFKQPQTMQSSLPRPASSSRGSICHSQWTLWKWDVGGEAVVTGQEYSRDLQMWSLLTVIMCGW